MRLPSERELCALIAALTGLGCSLVYDLSPDQCGTNADCESFGANYLCEEGMCKAGSGGSGGSGMGLCQTTEDCVARDPTVFNVQPSACIEGTKGDPSTRDCVPLKTAECPVVLPAIEEKYLENIRGDNPIILGAYGFVPDDTLSSNFTRAYDLAFYEFTQENLGVPGPEGSRPVVLVVCDVDYPDRETLDRGLDHLVSDLKVPGLISALLSEDLQHAFEHVGGAEAGIFFMSPVETDTRLANVPDDNLMWHLLPAAEHVALPYAPLLTRTITYLTEARGVLEAGETVRVALVTGTDQRFLTDLRDTIYETIEFNGMSAAENNDAGNLISLGVTSFFTDRNADLSAQNQAILDFQPHIIIAATAHELFDKIIPVVESSWMTSQQARPFYLISPYNYKNAQYLTNALNTVPTLSQRLVGVNFASAPPELRHILDDFEFAWDNTFLEAQGQRGYENFYDAAYYLLYGISAGARLVNDFDGFDIVDGMRRLNDPMGPAFAVGRSDIVEALGQLSQNRRIYLNGTLGAPNFNAIDARTDPGSVWCVQAGPPVVELVDVSLYDPTSGELVDDGEFPCIPYF